MQITTNINQVILKNTNLKLKITVNNTKVNATNKDNAIIIYSGFIIFPKRPITGTKNSKKSITA